MINRYLPSYMQGGQIASPTMQAFILPDGTAADVLGNPIQQMSLSGGENNAPIFGSYGNQGSMGSLQQGIGSLLGIIDQNINQNPEISRLTSLRQILLDYNNQFGGGSMQPSKVLHSLGF